MNLTETRDAAVIDRVLNDPAVYPWISDDSCPPQGEYSCAALLARCPALFCLRVDLADGELGGVFGFFPLADGFELHTSLLENCRGRRAVQAGRAAVARYFQRGHTVLRSFTIADEPQTEWYARRLGFIDETGQDIVLPHPRRGRTLIKRDVVLTRERWNRFCIET